MRARPRLNRPLGQVSQTRPGPAGPTRSNVSRKYQQREKGMLLLIFDAISKIIEYQQQLLFAASGIYADQHCTRSHLTTLQNMYIYMVKFDIGHI